MLNKLVDSAAGTFTASYDTQGRTTSQSYPNGMTAKYTYNAIGDATGLEYVKEKDCSTKCPEVWFSDSTMPSIHGETMKQASSLSEEPSYTYDAAGRLTQVQEIPKGETCTTRAYAYDEEGDRLSLATYKPNSKGECATEEGTTERHTYDEADRLTDEGTKYEQLGNTTSLPAGDAGGSALESSYYLDGQVHTQTQDGKTLEYQLDPEDRTLATITGGKTMITHYDAPGSAVAWTSEEEGKKWVRDIPGIGGELAAVQTYPGNTVLELHDLQGNVVAEASVSETETKLLKTYNSTEFGVPNSKEAPPKYAWLGADGVASEFPSGTITQDGSTYVPQTGRALQTQGIQLPTPINAASAYTRPIEAWVGVTLGEGAAREQSKAEQERKTLEEANKPPGIIPGCTEEAAYCGPDPEHGDNIDKCKVGAEVRTSDNGVTYEGKYYCEYVNVFELHVVLWEQRPNGGFIEVPGSLIKNVFNDIYDDSTNFLAKDWDCEGGRVFLAWAWGRYWHGYGGATIWSDARTASHSITCEMGSPPVADGGDAPKDDGGGSAEDDE